MRGRHRGHHTAEKAVVRGYRKWPQDYNKCFGFWVSGGNTFACTLCLKVCPWNKPRTFVHRVSMYGAARSLVARRVLYYISVENIWGSERSQFPQWIEPVDFHIGPILMSSTQITCGAGEKGVGAHAGRA